MALISTAPTARLHRLRVSSERYDCDGLHARVVRAVGLEPTRRCHRGILSPLRLPVPPRPLWSRDQRLSAFSGEVESGVPKTRPSLTHDPPKCERFGDKILPHFNIFAPCCLRQSLNPVTRACFRQSLGLSVYQGRMLLRIAFSSSLPRAASAAAMLAFG